MEDSRGFQQDREPVRFFGGQIALPKTETRKVSSKRDIVRVLTCIARVSVWREDTNRLSVMMPHAR